MAHTFADLLTTYRRAAGLTQEQLADRAYLSLAAVSALERGVRRRPHHNTVTALAKALALTAEQQATFTTASRAHVKQDGPAAQVDGRVDVIVPRQLPAVPGDFTGREVELAALDGVLSGAAVVAITGMAGAGKTTLALQAAHAADYPDGQIYLDLRGFGDTEPVRPLDALTTILGAFGVADVPLETDQASAQLRTVLAGRRALLLLDNARDAQQVEPLLPGVGSSAAIVTSRGDLSMLPTTYVVRLGLWSEQDGLDYLRKTVGDRVTQDPRAARDVVKACGFLPLAVRIAAARLNSRPTWTVAHLHDLLHDERLDQLQSQDLGVRASFAVSLSQLDPKALEAFQRIGLFVGPDLTLDVAACLFDWSEQDTRRALEELCDLHLAESPAPGRYRLHDLLRSYARELAPTAERTEALTRVTDLYAAVAWRAIEANTPNATRLPWYTAQTADVDNPLTWLDGQRPYLVALMTEPVRPQSLIRLAVGLHSFYVTRGYWLDWQRVLTTALELPNDDPAAEGFLRNDLGLVIYDLVLAGAQDTGDAVRQLRLSLEAFEKLGEDAPTAMSLTNLSHVFSHSGRHADAVETALRAVELYRRIDDAHGEALAQINLAQSYGGLGRPDDQRQSYNRSIGLATADGDDRVLAEALLGSGTAYRQAGDLELAIDELTRSAEVNRVVDDQVQLAQALDELGVALRQAGRRTEAIARHEEALQIAEQFHDGFRQDLIRAHLADARD